VQALLALAGKASLPTVKSLNPPYPPFFQRGEWKLTFFKGAESFPLWKRGTEGDL